MKNVVELARRLMKRGIDVVDVLFTALSREVRSGWEPPATGGEPLR
ncbi:MAG: hypothetical protein RXN82_03775 [Caldivirga sp.]